MRSASCLANIVGSDAVSVGEWECVASSTSVIYCPSFLIRPDEIGAGTIATCRYMGIMKGAANTDPAEALSVLLYESAESDDPSAPQTGRATAATVMLTHAVSITHRSTAGTDDARFRGLIEVGFTQMFASTFAGGPACRQVLHSDLSINPIASDPNQSFRLTRQTAKQFVTPRRLTLAFQKTGSTPTIWNPQLVVWSLDGATRGV